MIRQINRIVPRKLAPLIKPARYKAAFGGRGSGKSHFFAEQIIQDAYTIPGLRVVCIREVQKSLKESAKRLLEDKLQTFGLGEADGFKVLQDRIETPGNGVIIFQGMQDHTAESIKSLEGYQRAWIEEAQTLSARSLGLLRPTIRAEGSQIFFSWNPTRKSDPVDQMFRNGDPPTDSAIASVNWNDNPMFPSVLEQERQDCLRSQPDQYPHIWEGDYATVLTGAYYAAALAEARQQGRIGRVQPDPLMQVRAFWDIGFNDATAIWIAQFIGREIRVLDYYEAQGQPLAAHLDWLRLRGWDGVLCVLPHDGAHGNAVTGIRFEDHIRQAGFKALTIENMGKGAAMKRIEATRRLFPSIWFNEETCRGGLDALGWYHEKRDPARGIGLGPEHDWSSHACLTGDALVDTARGLIPISDVVAGDNVRTPNGFAHVSFAGLVKTANEIIRLTFEDGTVLESTPNHKIFTIDGLRLADTLGINDYVHTRKSAPCLSQANGKYAGYRAAFTASFAGCDIGSGKNGVCTVLNAMARNCFYTACCSLQMMAGMPKVWTSFPATATGKISAPQTGGQIFAARCGSENKSIFPSFTVAFGTIRNPKATTKLAKTKVENFFIAPFGWQNVVQSPKVSTFTTSTGTKPITGLKIWSSLLLQSTSNFTRKQTRGLEANATANNWRKRAKKLLIGTRANRVWNGIAKTVNALGKTENLSQRCANVVAAITRLFIQTNQDSALRIVKCERLTNVNVPVYDLTVDRDHCYFANGLLVSNSDAFGLLCVAYEAPREKPKPRENMHAVAGSWMG